MSTTVSPAVTDWPEELYCTPDSWGDECSWMSRKEAEDAAAELNESLGWSVSADECTPCQFAQADTDGTAIYSQTWFATSDGRTRRHVDLVRFKQVVPGIHATVVERNQACLFEAVDLHVDADELRSSETVEVG